MPYSPKKRKIVKIVVSKTEAQKGAIINVLDFLQNQSSNTPPKACLSTLQVSKMYGVAETTLRHAIKNGVPHITVRQQF